MSNLILAEESYALIGICMEVHSGLGMGFKEVIYKDALKVEFLRKDIPYLREKRFDIFYKGEILKHSYAVDFIVYEPIVLEVKATTMIVNGFVKQTLNYLKATDLRLGIIANFGQASFVSRRIVF